MQELDRVLNWQLTRAEESQGTFGAYRRFLKELPAERRQLLWGGYWRSPRPMRKK